MNHKPKFSLILLIPFSTFASQAPESKVPNKGIIFCPGKGSSKADVTSLKNQSESSTDDISSKSSDSSANNPVTKAIAAAAIAKNLQGNDDELGAAYRRIPAPEQKGSYVTGKDGIAKLTRLENSDSYIARLLRDGKFADAANHNDDSFLPDHLRRAVSSKQDNLITRSATDKQTLIDLLRKQRESNSALFASIFPLFDAITRHTAKQVTLDTIDAFQQKIRGIQTDKKALLETITKEISEQDTFLEDLFGQLERLRKSQASQQSDK